MWHPTEGVKFMQDITKKYGGVVRLNGVLGVWIPCGVGRRHAVLTWRRRENYLCQILWHCSRSPSTTHPYGNCPPRSLRGLSQSLGIHRSLTLYRTNSVLFGEGLPGTTGTITDNLNFVLH
jgi:hypothetical protein